MKSKNNNETMIEINIIIKLLIKTIKKIASSLRLSVNDLIR